MNLLPDNGKVLADAGVLLAYHTDDPITDSRFVFALRCHGGSLWSGSRETALRSVTINGAKMLDLQDRVGSLTVGKDADFIVLSGDPLSLLYPGGAKPGWRASKCLI